MAAQPELMMDKRLPKGKPTASSTNIPLSLGMPTPEYKHKTDLPWILQHVLKYEVSCELPLRIMFSFNAGHRLPDLKDAHAFWDGQERGKRMVEFLSSLDKTSPSAEDYNRENTSHHPSAVADSPTVVATSSSLIAVIDSPVAEDHPNPKYLGQGLPVSFIKDFALMVFRWDYSGAKFDQALVALDYLRDLECTRRTALRETAERLGINGPNWRDELSENQTAISWIEKVQKQELAIEAFYGSIYVDIRIWIMIHTLQAKPFLKTDVIAMLNTLFPPSVRELPNDRINPKVLNKYRSTFYRYISSVEVNGSIVLDAFLEKLFQPGTRHSWRRARENLGKYLNLAEVMVEQAREVHGIDYSRDRPSSGNSRLSSRKTSTFSTHRSTTSSGNTSFEGTCPTLSTPISPASSFDNSSIRSKGYRDRKSRCMSDTQNSLKQPPSLLPTRTPERVIPEETSRARTPSIAVTSRVATPHRDPDTIDKRHSLSWPIGPPVKRRLTPEQRMAAHIREHRRMMSAGRSATSQGLRSDTVSISERAKSQCSDRRVLSTTKPLPKLPSDNGKFLFRPADGSEVPALKTKASIGNYFARKKQSADLTIGQKENVSQVGLGIDMESSSIDGTGPDSPRIKKRSRFGILKRGHATDEYVRPHTSASFRTTDGQGKRKMSLSSLFVMRRPAVSDPYRDSISSRCAIRSVPEGRSQISLVHSDGRITPQTCRKLKEEASSVTSLGSHDAVNSSSNIRRRSFHLDLRKPRKPYLFEKTEEYRTEGEKENIFAALENARSSPTIPHEISTSV